MIILTPAQAVAVRGVSSPGHTLDPVMLISGNYVLEESVLTDPFHKTKWAALAGLPTRAVAANEYPVNVT